MTDELELEEDELKTLGILVEQSQQGATGMEKHILYKEVSDISQSRFRGILIYLLGLKLITLTRRTIILQDCPRVQYLGDGPIKLRKSKIVWFYDATAEGIQFFRRSKKHASNSEPQPSLDRASVEVRNGMQVIKTRSKRIGHMKATSSGVQHIRAQERQSDEILSPNEQYILIAMFEMQSTDSDSRQTQAKIDEKAFGPTCDSNALKSVFSKLKKRGFILASTGPRGGYWLSEKGNARAKILKYSMNKEDYQ
ncbi:hypothetical protein Pla110_23620 [Polystyrenella longa]|uniref:Uncharacterized protein n=1 Tax=Polystyrenella longa TaxID=2528007 RepID=A0A518CN31_9PLAN|nr:Rrf2 family transcriptional regulator [Polystyrenella longa]QDU80631.1 hypothetical protein Pla110_23620 [Polystyrenella longa]